VHKFSITQKNSVKVEGKMSQQGADFTGKILAVAALILACGGAISLVIYALHH